ncbi:MAG: hypothetical protein GYA24_23535 [Candidatus Lokiarchaeota archaeon]|nr:hypothetical protein [Candidatus Lokiarchaeota archaeon]
MAATWPRDGGSIITRLAMLRENRFEYWLVVIKFTNDAGSSDDVGRPRWILELCIIEPRR